MGYSNTVSIIMVAVLRAIADSKHPPHRFVAALVFLLGVDNFGTSKALDRIGPYFLCLPERVVGMPVTFAILRFAEEMPTARFHENDRPGMPVLLRRRATMPSYALLVLDFGFRG
jgi:hypothetical protein